MKLTTNTNILIVGLGLMGGSYAIALKKKGYRVSCITRTQSSVDYALENGIIDYGTTEVEPDLVGEADLSGLEAVKAKASDLPDHDLGSHWYDAIKLPVSLAKKGKKAHSAAFDQTALSYLEAFLAVGKTAPHCEASPKLEKASVYVEGLLTHGGPSTDVFKKGIGDEKTGMLFRTVLFGTEK